MFLETFIIAFSAILVLEFGDKTQLIVLSISTKHKTHKLSIITGFFLAILTITLIGVFLGNLIKEFLPENLLNFIGALLFISIGLYSLFDYYKDRKEAKENENEIKYDFANSFKIILSQTFVAIFLVEIGDKSQLFVVTLSTQYSELIAITLGATFAMTSLAIVAVLVGEVLLKMIPENLINLFSASLFIIVGIALLILD